MESFFDVHRMRQKWFLLLLAVCSFVLSPWVSFVEAAEGITPVVTSYNDRIEIFWDAVSGAESYTLQKAESEDGEYTDIDANLTGTTTTVSEGLTAGKTYWFRVKDNTHSTTGTAVAGAIGLQVTGLTATAGSKQVKLDWTAVDGAAKYLIEQSSSASSGFALIKTVTTNTYTVTGLSGGQTYYFRVQAKNAENVGNDEYSDVKSATVPMGLKATAGVQQVTLSWDTVSGAASYRIQQKTGSESDYSPAKVSSGTSETITGLAAGQTYTFKVEALDSLSEKKTESTEVSAIPVFPAPKDVKAAIVSSSVSLSWSAVSGENVVYEIQQSTSASSGFKTVKTSTAVSATISDLLGGVTYYYQVRARNSVVAGAYSTAVKVTTTHSGVPANVKATAGAGKVSLSWDVVSGAAYYVVQKSTSQTSGFATYKTVTDTTLEVTGLAAGTTYYFRVQAKNDSAGGAYSTVVSAKPLLAAPTNVTAEAGIGKVSLNWNTVSGAAGYTVERSTAEDFKSDKTSVSVTATSATVTGLNAGQKYYFRVMAKTSAVGGEYSTVVSATPKLSAPANLKATAGAGQVTLSWTAVSGATAYIVQKSETAEESGFADEGDEVTAASLKVTGLTAGTKYYFRVKAKNEAEAEGGAYSDIMSAVPIFTAPTNLKATAGTGKVSLSWDAVSGATSYSVQKSTSQTTGFSTYKTGVTATNLDVTGLSGSVRYYFRVAAVSTACGGVYSTVVSAMPELGVPENLKLTAASGQVTISWTAVSGASSYEVQQSTSAGSDFKTVQTVTKNTATVTGLTAGQTYYFRVQAKNASGSGAYSTVMMLLAAPVNVKATAGTGKVSLSWTVVSGAAEYIVEKSTSQTSGFTAAGEAVTETTMDVTGLTAGTTYYFRVQAKNETDKGSYSTVVAAVPQFAAPANPKATAGIGKISVSWSAVSGATAYVVEYAVVEDFKTKTAVNVSVTSATISGLTPGQLYYFRVMAKNASGSGAYSTVASATPKLSAPTNLKATVGAGSVTLSWTAVNGAESYIVEQSETTEDSGFAAVGDPVTTNSLQVTGLSSGTKYYFRVKAKNANVSEDGAYSDIKSAVPLLTAPQNAKAEAGAGKVSLSWDAVDGAESYTVQKSTSQTSGFANYKTGITETSLDVTGLSGGVRYYFRVMAKNSACSGAYSAVVSAVPELGVPVVEAEPGGGRITLSWAAIGGAVSYDVQQSTSESADFETVKTVTANSALITGLVNGETYYFRVRANGSSESGAFSDVISAVPALGKPVVTAKAGSVSVTLSWKALSGASGYVVEKSDAEDSGFEAVGSAVTTTSKTISGLQAGQTYYFRVMAKAGEDSGEYSTVVSAIPLFAAPANVKATGGSGQVSLSWSAVSGASGYVVQKSTSKTSGFADVKTVTGTTLKVTGLSAGTTYYFRVRAKTETISGAYSTVVSAVTLCAAPTGVKATAGTGSVSLSWTKVSGASGYVVEKSTSKTTGYKAVKTVTTTSLSVTGLTAGKTYYFRVTAKNASGTGKYSAVAAAVPGLGKVTNLEAEVSPAKVKLSWTKVSGATSYIVQQSTSKSSGYKTVKTVTSGSVTIKDLKNGKRYYFRVQAKNASGTGSFSSVKSAVPVIEVPTEVKAVGGVGKVTLTWEEVNGVSTYVVQQSASKSSGFKTVTTVKTNTAVISGLKTGTKYYFRVQAKHSSGVSKYSEVVLGVPTALDAPKTIKASAKQGAVKLTWKAVKKATSYSVQMSQSEDTGFKVVKVVKDATSFTVSGLKSGVTYYFRVQAKNASGSGAYSAVVSAVPKVPVPTAPKNFKAKAGEEKVTLSWTKVSEAAGYIVEAALSKSFDDIEKTVTVTSNSAVIKALEGGTKYYFRVQAKNSAGSSPYSAVVSVKPLEAEDSQEAAVMQMSAPKLDASAAAQELDASAAAKGETTEECNADGTVCTIREKVCTENECTVTSRVCAVVGDQKACAEPVTTVEPVAAESAVTETPAPTAEITATETPLPEEAAATEVPAAEETGAETREECTEDGTTCTIYEKVCAENECTVTSKVCVVVGDQKACSDPIVTVEPVVTETAAAEEATAEPEATETAAAEEATAEPETTETAAAEEATAEPETTETAWAEEATAEPETTETAAAEEATAEPETTETAAAEEATAEPETTETAAAEEATAEPEVTEEAAAEPETTETATVEEAAAEPEVTEAAAVEEATAEPEETEAAAAEEATEAASEEPAATEDLTIREISVEGLTEDTITFSALESYTIAPEKLKVVPEAADWSALSFKLDDGTLAAFKTTDIELIKAEGLTINGLMSGSTTLRIQAGDVEKSITLVINLSAADIQATLEAEAAAQAEAEAAALAEAEAIAAAEAEAQAEPETIAE